VPLVIRYDGFAVGGFKRSGCTLQELGVGLCGLVAAQGGTYQGADLISPPRKLCFA
jgi:hypothetical protein